MTDNSSRIGSAAELAVATQAMHRGFDVAQPFGMYSKYDLIIDVNDVLIKLQVKSLSQNAKAGSLVCCSKRTIRNRSVYGTAAYRSQDFDFAACYFRPTQEIFLIPFNVFTSVKYFTLSKKRQDLYREAWHLLEEFAASRSGWRQTADFNPLENGSDSQ